MRRWVVGLLLGAGLAVQTQAGAIDYKCVADCRADGSSFDFCQSRCAYKTPPVTLQSAPMIPPILPRQRGMKYQCLASCQSQSIDDGYCHSACGF